MPRPGRGGPPRPLGGEAPAECAPRRQIPAAEHRRVLRLLEESRQRFRDVAELAGDFIWETGPDHRFTYISERFQHLSGIDTCLLLGRTPIEAAANGTTPAAWRRHMPTIDAHRPLRDFIYTLRHGSRDWHLRINGRPLFDAEGRFAGYRGTGTDITAETEARAAAGREARMLSLVFDNMAEGMVIIGADLTVLAFNQRIADLSRVPRDRFRVGDKLEDVIRYRAARGDYGPGNVEALVRERMEPIIQGVPRLTEREMPGGQFLEIRATPLPGGGMLITCADITERRRADLALRNSEQRFRDVAEVAGDWIWETGPDLRLTYVSAGYQTSTGIDPKTVLGMTRMEAAGADPRDPAWRRHQADLDARRPFRNFLYQCADHRGDGLRHVRVSGKPVFDGAGGFLGYRGVGRDVTEEKRIEARLIEAKEAAEFANRTKGHFLANVSHELRTPLNAIIGFSEVLSRELFGPIGSPQYRQYAKDIFDSGRHLLNIINEILDLSKAEAGKIELAEELVDLAEVIEDALRLVSARASEAGIGLAADLRQRPIRLLADRRRLKQILLNLLSNAVKFTPGGGRVEIQAAAERGVVTIAVADTGIGMRPDDIPKALQPFTQIDGALNRKYDGTGLGLPLTNALVQLHGGSLGVESQPGIGTTVTVTLPAERLAGASA